MRRPRVLGKWWHGILFVALLLAVFLAVASRGADQAAQGSRVLSSLDPAVHRVQTSGRAVLEWLSSHPALVGWVVTGLAAALAVTALFAGRLRALPVPFLLGGVALATWGQLMLATERPKSGWLLYAAGTLCAAIVGVWRPLDRLPGFPRLPLLTERSPASNDGLPGERGSSPRAAGPARPISFAEYLIVFGLTLLALFTRAYALNELPGTFDDETISIMTTSYTLPGVSRYVTRDLLGTGNGVFHVLTNFVLYGLFGASIYTVRLTALFWGVAAIPLFYWLVRRLAGTWPAILTTLLFVAAPEQLFWSRNENSFFAPVTVLALITAHLVLTMVTRFSFPAVLAVALWMPVCRYFYTPSFVMFTLPLLMFGHSLIFVRGALRKAWYVAPLLLVGILLWVFSLSVVTYSLDRDRDQGWQFVHPAKVRGVEAWKQGLEPGAGPFEIVRAQARRIGTNLRHVVTGMTDDAQYSSHWYARFYVSPGHRTMINAGLAVFSALGIGYLLGQIRHRRAAVLLFWVGVGLLPACMSDEPEARRLALVFPALTIIAGVFIGASVRIVRESAGRWIASGAAAGLGVAAGLVAFTSLASHLLLPITPLAPDREIRFTKPLFERSDTVLHNLFYRSGEMIAFGNLDRLMDQRSPRCLRYVEQTNSLSAALDPRCDFADPLFQRLLSPGQIESRRAAHRENRVGYVLRINDRNRGYVELLRGLVPSARPRELRLRETEDRLVVLEVDMAEVRKLRSPELQIGASSGAPAGLENGLVRGVRLLRKTGPFTPLARGLVVRGSILLPSDGWFHFQLDPPCAAAEVWIDDSKPSERGVPLLAGIHSFEIRLATAGACPAPFGLLMVETTGAGPEPKPVELLFSPRVAALPQARAARLVAGAGYGEVREVARLPESPADFDIDGQGNLYVLVRHDGTWKIRRFDPDGRANALFSTGLSEHASASMSVGEQGNCVVVSLGDVQILDRTGKRVQSWKLPPHRPPSDVAWTTRNRILISWPHEGVVRLYSPEGLLEGSLEKFEGGNGRFTSPAGLAVSSEGGLLVVEESGQATLFQLSGDHWPPRFLSSFPVSYPDVPLWQDLTHCAFDGPGRILFPHRSRRVPLVYNLRGERILASSLDRDLSGKPFKLVHEFASAPDSLFVVDLDQSVVYRLSRP